MAFRSDFTRGMQKDMYQYYMEAEQYQKLQAVYPQLFEVVQMEGAYEQSTSALGMSKLSERKEGDKIAQSNPGEGYTIPHKARDFSDSFTLTSNTVEDFTPSKLGNILQKFASGWQQGLIDTKEEFAAKFFNKGGYTAGHDVFNNAITGVIADDTGDLGYDGQPFFALEGNEHTTKGGGSYFNSIAQAFSGANLQTAYNRMTNSNNYDEKGNKIALRPQVILIPSALRFSVDEVLRNTDTANLRSSVEGLVTPIEWQYLTDTDAWFLGVPKKGLKFYERRAPIIDVYQDEEDKKYHVTIDTRFGAGMDNWRFWQGNNLSTS